MLKIQLTNQKLVIDKKRIAEYNRNYLETLQNLHRLKAVKMLKTFR